MFIGHFAVGFASKRMAPRASLGVLIAAPLLLDLLWPIFLLLGWESVRIDPGNTAFTPLVFDSYPISHSLVTSIGWALLFALSYWSLTRDRRAAWVIGLGVASHWVLDFVTHRPDMPVAPGGAARLGLGLWNSVPATIVVEGLMFAAGVWIYRATTLARDRIGHYGFVSLVALLIVLYADAAQGSPPPSVQVLKTVSLGIWMFPFLAAWVDRHRVVIQPVGAPREAHLRDAAGQARPPERSGGRSSRTGG